MMIGAVALIVIGPKDLPKALRTVGQVVGKIRRMASEFQGQFAEAMREAELDDVKRQIQGVNNSVSSFNPIQSVRDELKGAVETPPAGESKAASQTATGTDQAQAHNGAAPEPTIALPPVPQVADAGDAIAQAVGHVPAPPEAGPVVPTEAATAERPTERTQ